MVQEIDVTDGSDSGTEVECSWIKEEGLADLFQVIGEIPTVKRIHGLDFCKGIQGIEPDLVVSVLNRLEELKLCYGYYNYHDDQDKEVESQLNLTTICCCG